MSGGQGVVALLWRGGDIVGPAGVLRAWAAWLRASENQDELGWPGKTIEYRLARWGCGTGSAAELTPPELAVQSLQQAQVLGMWCQNLLGDCEWIQRRAVRHRYVDGLGWDEIAIQLGGRPVNGVAPLTADEVVRAVGAVQDRIRKAIRATVAECELTMALVG